MKFTVSPEEAGMKLLAFLREKSQGSSHSVKALKRAIDAGRCRINGLIETFSTHPLKKGDRIELLLEEKKEKTPQAKLRILYEDPDFLICDKPAGLVSENQAFQACLPTYGKELQLVHRLDKETSGVILLAKTARGLEAMKELFKQREVHKVYLALVEGVVKEDAGKIDDFLGKKQSYQGQNIWGRVKPEKGQRALTSWKCLKRGKSASLLVCKPLTGRTHQLRVHLSEMGYPILGDILYAKTLASSYRPPRLLLHAKELSFKHPFTGKQLSVAAEIPGDFEEALKTLKF